MGLAGIVERCTRSALKCRTPARHPACLARLPPSTPSATPAEHQVPQAVLHVVLIRQAGERGEGGPGG
jgi:hypothetical protein